jgi:hypothetical protein
MQYEAPSREEPAAHPTAVTVHQTSRVLEVAFDDGAAFRIPFELMRVYARGSDTLFLFGPTPHPYGEHDE